MQGANNMDVPRDVHVRVKNILLEDIMENGVSKHPMLLETFGFVKKVPTKLLDSTTYTCFGIYLMVICLLFLHFKHCSLAFRFHLNDLSLISLLSTYRRGCMSPIYHVLWQLFRHGTPTTLSILRRFWVCSFFLVQQYLHAHNTL